MFCKHCGKENKEEAKFCKYCGAEIMQLNFFTNETKFCPFCKEEISSDKQECPNCKRILVEKIPSDQIDTVDEFNNQPKESIISKFISFSRKINYRKLLFNKYVVILLGVIFVVWISLGDDSSYNSGGTKVSLPPPSTQVSDSVIEFTPTAVSLANGTILKKNSVYLKGYGELQIKNGTNLDAVAKLIRSGASVLTVYIKANSTYTMLNISDGTYWLAFAQGLDWDSTTQKFRRNTQYSVFDETFYFVTTNREYTIFEVTLNPVVGGTAETSDVDSQQFDAY